MSDIAFLDRPLIITDFETTGLDEHVHEIIEIGALRVDQRTLELEDEFEIKVRPERIETASPRALEINGYDPALWTDAVPLVDAVGSYAAFARDGLLSSHNIVMEWKFIDAALRAVGIDDTMDYHRVDLWTLAWSRLRDSGLTKFNLAALAPHLGIPEEPRPHRAIHGARTAYEVLKKLMPAAA